MEKSSTNFQPSLSYRKFQAIFPSPNRYFTENSRWVPLVYATLSISCHLSFFCLDEQFYFTIDFSKDGKLWWRCCYLLGPLYDGHDHFGGFRRQGKMDHNYFIENFTESKREETKRKIKLILDTLVRVEDITYVNVMGQSSWEISLRSKRLSSRKYF